MSFTVARVTAAIDAAVEDTTHIQLHTGDPGGSGTSNVAAATEGREGFVFPGATSGETEQSAEFTITGSSSAITHATGWDQSSDGTHQWTAVLSPQESFGGAGSLEVTITATAANAD